ncbi:MAG: GNAT family N-acetyltransferase [Rhodospirillales bacterium]|nr:MAG: GNAT family N-acetyltransferase [Rhodospirillales bacterium]
MDAPAIARVHVESWRTAYAGLLPETVLVRMSLPNHTALWARVLGQRRNRDVVLVAEGGGHGVIAFGSCGRVREKRLAPAGEIYTLYVHPEFQNRGIGQRLLLRLFDALVARGLTSAVAWVLAENPSRFFYETMGGRRVAERNEPLGTVTVHEAAYGWSDITQFRAQTDARKA